MRVALCILALCLLLPNPLQSEELPSPEHKSYLEKKRRDWPFIPRRDCEYAFIKGVNCYSIESQISPEGFFAHSETNAEVRNPLRDKSKFRVPSPDNFWSSYDVNPTAGRLEVSYQQMNVIIAAAAAFQEHYGRLNGQNLQISDIGDAVKVFIYDPEVGSGCRGDCGRGDLVVILNKPDLKVRQIVYQR